MGPSIRSSKGPTCEPSSTSLVVSAAATTRPVSASTPMCSLRHDRRRLVPCFSTNHSPAPESFNPVLSTNRCTGSALDGGRATASVSARRLSVECRDGEIETEQADDGADQPFGLPQSQAEHDAQRQRRRDRQGRIVWLTARRSPWFGAPGRDRLVAEPDRQTSTLAQGSIIFRPVRYPIPLPGDVMTAIGIDLERHGGHSKKTMDGVASSQLGDGSAGFAARGGLRAGGNPDQPPRTPALGRKDGPPRYSGPRRPPS